MRRIHFCNIPHARKDLVAGALLDAVESSDVPEKLKQILDVIYSVNPTLGYPQGDLAIWISDKANPEIKAFIEKNLIRQIDAEPSAVSMSTELTNSLRTAITDDDIANFYRRKGETQTEYSERMYGYLQNMKIRSDIMRDVKKRVKAAKESLNEE